MLARFTRLVLPARLRPRYDAWLTDHRWRHGIRMEPTTEVTDRLLADGYRYTWRIHSEHAIGHTLDGQRVAISFEVFIRRYLADDSS